MTLLDRLKKKLASGRLRVRWATQLRGVTHHSDLEVHSTVVFERGGVQLGRRVRIRRGVRVNGPCVVEDGVFINEGAYIGAETHIGRRCSIAPYVSFVTGNHDTSDPEHRAGATTRHPISVGPGTWVGHGGMVLPGITIGSGVVVAAGALVTKDVPDNSLVAGVPARIVRTLPT